MYVIRRGRVLQGSAYADTNNGLKAYSTENGSQLWHVSADSSQNQFREIALANGVLYATQTAGASALDAHTGKRLWRYQAKPPLSGFLAPLTTSTTLYISNFTSGLVALERHTGHLRWQAQAGGNGMQPALVAGALFVGDGQGLSRRFVPAMAKSSGAFPFTVACLFPQH